MKIVIAGNIEQYRNFLIENNCDYRKYKYAYKKEDLCGFNNIEIIKIGEWWKNPIANLNELKISEK